MLKTLARRIGLPLLIVAGIVALNGATAQAKPGLIQPAQAQALAAYGVCPDGYWCGWEDIGYSGNSILFGQSWRGQCYSFTGFWSQRISSWQNYIGAQTSSHDLWGCPSYQGTHIWGYNGFTVGDARVWGFNDATVSVYWWP